MTAHERALLEDFARRVKEVVDRLAIAPAAAQTYADSVAEEPSDRYPLMTGWLQGSCTNAAKDLESIVASYLTPTRRSA